MPKSLMETYRENEGASKTLNYNTAGPGYKMFALGKKYMCFLIEGIGGNASKSTCVWWQMFMLLNLPMYDVRCLYSLVYCSFISQPSVIIFYLFGFVSYLFSSTGCFLAQGGRNQIYSVHYSVSRQQGQCLSHNRH